MLPVLMIPGQLEMFKKRLCRINAGSGQMVYVYFQNPTYPGDFSGTDFMILVMGQYPGIQKKRLLLLVGIFKP